MSIDPQRIKRHLDRLLPVYVVAAILCGFAAGHLVPVNRHQGLLKVSNLAVVVLMVYPMMVNLDVRELRRGSGLAKAVLTALAMGLIVSPLLMYGILYVARLAHLVVNPELALGLMLAVIVPCSSMSVAYTGFSRGNVEVATVIVVASFVLAVAAVPAWLALFASAYDIDVSVWLLVKTLLVIVLAPMALGMLTRWGLERLRGKDGFRRVAPLFPSLSLVGMFLIVFLIFMEKARLLGARPATTGFVLLPLLVFYLVALLGLTALNRLARLSYRDHMAVAFTAIGKNEGTAMAIAMTASLGLVAVPPAVAPVLQIPLLVGYVKLAPWIERTWSRR